MRKLPVAILLVTALLLAACEGVGPQKYTETVEESFAVGDAPVLTVDSFGGDVTVQEGDGDTIQVVATKRASREKDLDDIEVSMKERDGGVEITTDRPSGFRNVSVELEITAPASTRVDVRTGGGDVSIHGLQERIEVDTGGGDIAIRDASGTINANTGGGRIDIDSATGEIDADTGGGSITVRDASGPVRLNTGGGSIDYGGRPQDRSDFETGGGSIKLRLPADINVQVDLETGGGRIEMEFPVDGHVSERSVNGTIGTGEEGEVHAETGGGSITVISQ